MNIAALEAAFRATTYRVETPEGSFGLRIGQGDAVFDDFLRRQGVFSWGILSACNPQAKCLSNGENRRRQGLLVMRLEALGWRFFAACNLSDTGDWPPEPGCLIVQVSEEALRALGREFSQVAVVFGKTGSAPCLLWV